MSEIKPIGREDYPALSAFCAAFADEKRPASFWLARFQHWWEDNPAFTQEWVRGYQIIEQGQLHGMMCGIPMSFKVGEAIETTCHLTTWRVSDAMRSQSLLLFTKTVGAMKGCVYFAGEPISKITPIYRSFKFDLLRDDPQASVFILNPLLKGPFKRVGRFLAARWPKPRLATRVELVAKADAPFDRLWERSQGQTDFSLIRSRPFLDWFVFRTPKKDKFLLAAYDGRGEVLGLVILEDTRTPRLLLLDLWCEGPSQAVAIDLLRAACAFGRQRGFDTLWVPHYHPFITESCQKAGFAPRRSYVTQLFVRRDKGFALPPDFRVYWTGVTGDKGL